MSNFAYGIINGKYFRDQMTATGMVPCLRCLPPSFVMNSVRPLEVTLSVTTVDPGCSLSMMADMRAIKRLLHMFYRCDKRDGVCSTVRPHRPNRPGQGIGVA